jgi:hypothetical protein
LSDVTAIDFSMLAYDDGSDIRLEQLAAMADALVAQAAAVRDHYEQLQHALDETPAEHEPTVGGARPVDDAYDDLEVWEDGGGDEPHVHDSVRLVVMEMAMSGSSREETREYLRDSLGVQGGEPIVDEVFDRTEAAQDAAPLHRRLFTRRRD